jgi:hypothetical protein
MAGTKLGGRKIVLTIYSRYGIRYFELLGRAPKPKGRGAGFASNPELARIAGRKGGMASRRRKI